MYPHHEAAIHRLTRHFEQDPEPRAVLLTGSIAHGFEREDSDVDLVIVVSDDDYEARLRDRRLQFFDAEVCDYPGGYSEEKYVAESFLDEVAESGSEPARFALHDARPLVERADYRGTLARIGRYPVEGKSERIRRFFGQLEAWHWYTTEGLRYENPYLLGTVISKLVLFGGRLLLTHNEILYPYHKWFLRVLERADDKPDGLMAAIGALYDSPTRADLDRFRELCVFHHDWDTPEGGWPTQFALDSELNWRDGSTPVDDL